MRANELWSLAQSGVSPVIVACAIMSRVARGNGIATAMTCREEEQRAQRDDMKMNKNEEVAMVSTHPYMRIKLNKVGWKEFALANEESIVLIF